MLHSICQNDSIIYALEKRLGLPVNIQFCVCDILELCDQDQQEIVGTIPHVFIFCENNLFDMYATNPSSSLFSLYCL